MLLLTSELVRLLLADEELTLSYESEHLSCATLLGKEELLVFVFDSSESTDVILTRFALWIFERLIKRFEYLGEMFDKIRISLLYLCSSSLGVFGKNLL